MMISLPPSFYPFFLSQFCLGAFLFAACTVMNFQPLLCTWLSVCFSYFREKTLRKQEEMKIPVLWKTLPNPPWSLSKGLMKASCKAAQVSNLSSSDSYLHIVFSCEHLKNVLSVQFTLHHFLNLLGIMGRSFLICFCLWTCRRNHEDCQKSLQICGYGSSVQRFIFAQIWRSTI